MMSVWFKSFISPYIVLMFPRLTYYNGRKARLSNRKREQIRNRECCSDSLKDDCFYQMLFPDIAGGPGADTCWQQDNLDTVKPLSAIVTQRAMDTASANRTYTFSRLTS